MNKKPNMGKHNSTEIQNNAIKTIRFLAADAIQNANSGHPGLSLGAATMAYTLWTRHLCFNPANPSWFNRDRFIIPGHGGMLLYSLLQLTGFDISLDDLKTFRQWGSKAAGAPEIQSTPGVDVTTGPLGQGFANGVGLAMAEAHLARIFNKPGFEIINHYVYGILTDGDLMEGITYEAASLAGHLQLKKIIYLYDDNQITIDGANSLSFTEDVRKRFEAARWNFIEVPDGNNVDSIDQAIKEALCSTKPTLIKCRTIIGYGLPERQGTPKAHGEAPSEKEINRAKEEASWPSEKFYVPVEVRSYFTQFRHTGESKEKNWNILLERYCQEFPREGSELKRRIDRQLPDNWNEEIPFFTPDKTGIPTRNASGILINHFSNTIPELIGGSADLASSCKTLISESIPFQSEHYEGRNIYYGVREQAMGGIVNGISLHGGLIPFAGTFLVFFDYVKPAIRVGAISRIPSIYVFTHDSIGVGEDGPTHQPIEHLASLRTIPNLVEIRPADANEVASAWGYALKRLDGPTVIVLSRQPLPVIDRNEYTSHKELVYGAYVLKQFAEGKPDIILMASGSEVELIIKAGQILVEKSINTRLISFPSWSLFKQQSDEYKNKILPPAISARLAVEAGSTQGWREWIGEKGEVIGIDQFGKSAPGNVLFEKYGFTVENVVEKALRLIDSV